MATGYSGTPLARKLGVKDAQRTWRYRMPASVAQEISDDGVCPKLHKAPLPGLEMVHAFVVSRADLSKVLHDVRELLDPSGVIWVSWPKKAAKVATDVSEDVIRAEALPLGLVDIKVCAVDETWSGLKLVIRKAERVKH
jgi:3-hydroxyisobutyrate dehydrogenase-like beta-hydroxyacid dehydrogenase